MNKKTIKLLSSLGVGLVALSAGAATTVVLSSCSKKVEETRELFEFADEKQTKILALTEYAKKQERIEIPRTVKSFDAKVFQNLKNTSIKELDFSKCTRLLNFPQKAFSQSSNIKTLLLPPNLKTINDTQISDLVNIERINWPSTISTDDMIKATWKLPIFIPSGSGELQTTTVTTSYQGKNYNLIDRKAKIYLVPNGYTIMKKHNNINFGNIKYLYFQDKSNLTTIEPNVFENAPLERIILPSSLRDVTSGNFWNLNNLVQLDSEDNFKNLSSFGSWNFVDLAKLKSLNFSGNSTIFGANNRTFFGLESLEHLLLPTSFNTFNPTSDGSNMYFNGAWDSLKYMPMPKSFNFNSVNNQTNKCSGKIRFVKQENNKFDYTSLYNDKEVRGIWIDASSKITNKPDMTKLPNVTFISYRDKTEYFK